ncbi:MAG: T9SS type A sorting domain-containing protein [Ignavibacteria bacterium]|nr:T9SS type A sorting domain-containing protein [Ignavibacteria bacterium]
MKKHTIFFCLLLLMVFKDSLVAQVKEDWVARYSFANISSVWNDTDAGNSAAIDEQGNVFVTGGSMRGSDNGSDIVTIKYSPTGVQEWLSVYKAPGNGGADYGTVIALDKQGNVYVAGSSYGVGTVLQDFITIKYNSAGQQQWEARYNGPGRSPEAVTAMALDSQGNVIITGQSEGGKGFSFDIATIKYNSAGVEQWVVRYNSPANFDDYPNSLVIDSQDNIYVVGQIRAAPGVSFDYVTIKYNSSGQQQWLKTFNGTGSGDDKANSVAVDGAGNVFVTGISTIDKNASYLTDIVTIKYDAAGNEVWKSQYDGPGKSTDGAVSIKLDGAGNIYVFGSSNGGLSTQMDYATIKYNPEGAKIWEARYNASGGNTEEAHAMVIDAKGDIYVTGNSAGPTGRDYTTIKYNSSGVEQWVMRYNGTGNAYDDALSIAVNSVGQVAITGSSPGATSATDYATVRYSQTTTDVESNKEIPTGFELSQNFPNPFNPETIISYKVQAASNVSLKVYDVLGREVATLVNDYLQAGNYNSQFAIRNSKLSSGVYFYTLKANGFAATKKMILMK